ncbi:hypothetical protein HK096_001654, partial [Nowakowskiella sp. JEL0078]
MPRDSENFTVKEFKGENFREWFNSYRKLAGRSEWSEEKKIAQVIWYVANEYEAVIESIPEYTVPEAEETLEEKKRRQKIFWEKFEKALDVKKKTLEDFYTIKLHPNEKGVTYIGRIDEMFRSIPLSIVPEAMKSYHLKHIIPAHIRDRIIQESKNPIKLLSYDDLKVLVREAIDHYLEIAEEFGTANLQPTEKRVEKKASELQSLPVPTTIEELSEQFDKKLRIFQSSVIDTLNNRGSGNQNTRNTEKISHNCIWCLGEHYKSECE